MPRVLYIHAIEQVTLHVPSKLMEDLIRVLICLCLTKIALKKILVFVEFLSICPNNGIGIKIYIHINCLVTVQNYHDANIIKTPPFY